jgi:hypothetical protein
VALRSADALVDRVIVCNRRGQPQQGNKGDHADAAEDELV